MSAPRPLTSECPQPIRRAWLRNDWEELTFLHWAYEPAVIQALLPSGLDVDTHNGKAWVSLVPFVMRRAGPTWLPPIPYISTFLETNVRTYVVDSAGNRAVWFLSLDCARLPIVLFARWTIGFPYVWSKMTLSIDGTRRSYSTSRRRWPGRPSADTRVVVDVGEAIAEPDDLDVFLTARWGTVARSVRTLRHHPVDHPPWRLRTATLIDLDDSAVTACGLPAPTGEPLVRWAELVVARFGRPATV